MYPRHSLVVLGGTLYSPTAGPSNEIWECTLRGTQADQPNQPVNDPVAYLNGIKGPLGAWYAAANNLMSAQSTLDYIKCNHIGPDGKYESKTITNRLDYSPKVIGGASQVYPDILSVAWSWRTGRTRGPGSHGRIYPPNMTTTTTASMSITTAQQAAHGAAAQRLLHLLEIGDGGTNALRLCVVSGVDASATPITRIVIGSIIDVQRRRKSNEAELYSSFPSQT